MFIITLLLIINISYSYNHLFNRFIIKTQNNNKDLITITPGGYKGFYTLGICHYIKENYNLENYYFSGASAGSWNALFLCFKGNEYKFIDAIFDVEIKDKRTLPNLEYDLKSKILSTFDDNEFDFSKLFIAVSTLTRFRLKTEIHNGFYSLEDAINCCIASSHIPLITGNLLYKYKNKYRFDGGISKNPLEKECKLLITGSMWNSTIINNSTEFKIVRGNKGRLTINDLKYIYELGYRDTEYNKDILDELFI